MDWMEGRDFRVPREEVARAKEAPPYNELQEDRKLSCHVVGSHGSGKLLSPTQWVAKAMEGEDESNQYAEAKGIWLALKTAKREKWSVLYLYTDSFMDGGNALWGWLQQWKQSSW